MRLLLALATVLSLVSIFNPHLSCQLQKGWQFKNAEPSDAYLLAIRIGGVISTITCLYLFWRV